MHRHILLFLVAAACGCFSESGGTGTEDSAVNSGESESGGDASDGTSTSTASSSDEGSAGTTSDGSTASSAAASDESEGSTGSGGIPLPRAIWRFDGDLTEDVAGANATGVGTVEFLLSPDGQAVALTTLGSYLDASAAAPLVLEALGSTTVLMRIAWVDNQGGDQTLWALGDSDDSQAPANNASTLGLEVGVLHLLTETGAGENHVADLGVNLIPKNEWATLVVTIDADTVRAYVAGELVGSAAYVPPETTATTFYLAGIADPDGSNTQRFQGEIDEVRFWDVVLDDAEVAAVSAQWE